MRGAPNSYPIDIRQVREFLETLFGEGDWIDARLIKPTGQTTRVPVMGVDAALKVIENKGGGVNVCVGIATRRSGSAEAGAGGKDGLRATRSLFVDYDDSPESLEVKLKSFPLPPRAMRLVKFIKR